MAVTEVYNNIFRADIPLPGSPLKSLNAFIIKGDYMNDERNLLIDTGFNTEPGYNAMIEAFVEIGVVKQDTDMFLTHLHADHVGLAGELKTPENKAFASPKDGRVMANAKNSKFWDTLETDSIKMGFPPDQILKYTDHPGYAHNNKVELKVEIVTPGTRLRYAGYDFEVIDLAGHTPGQIGLYEPVHKLLFAGDHILNKITPNITYWGDDFDALGVYLKNLKKVKELDIKHVFTAHRAPVENVYERIDQLLAHHDRRLGLCLEMLKEKPRTVYEISHGLNWDFGGGDFSKFPITQKWFAAGEAYAHMEHLYHTGRIKKNMENGVYMYSL
ncbi:MAG: MBL fold metallo-hydrolase [Clostridia bacterium]|nr:MBL fold metallo-hydrolase [Clostridia bacterium]